LIEVTGNPLKYWTGIQIEATTRSQWMNTQSPATFELLLLTRFLGQELVFSRLMIMLMVMSQFPAGEADHCDESLFAILELILSACLTAFLRAYGCLDLGIY
jgi:hypothetical protein